jgi:hypothetical protein
MAFLTLVIIPFVLYYLLTVLRAYFRLRHIPGPPLASISYVWLFLTDISGRAWYHHLTTASKYPFPLIRIGPSLLITSSPTIIRQMSSVRSKFLRGDWYNANRLDVSNPSMFGTRDTAWHDDIKARTSAGYSGKEVPGLEAEVDTCLGELKSLLRRKYVSKDGQTKAVDFARVVQLFAVDVIGRIGFGTEFGNLRADEDMTGYIAAMDAFAPVVTLCADVPWLRKVFLSEWVIKRVGPRSTDKAGPGRIMGVAKEEVDKRFEALKKGEDGKYQDMLVSLIPTGHGVG